MTDSTSDLPDERPAQTEPHQARQYPVQSYQQGYFAYQPIHVVPEPKGFSITALVLGLVSILFGFTFFVPLGALIFGFLGLRREPAGRGMAIAGIVIGSVFMLFWLILGGFFLALMLASLTAWTSIPTY